jgi:hypothetical protein
MMSRQRLALMLLACSLGAAACSGSDSAAPTLTAISPASAAAGNPVGVILTGTNFGSDVTVAVSGRGVSVTQVDVADSTSITATFLVDRSASLGARTVTLTSGGETSNAVTFTVTAPAASIGEFTASAATAGSLDAVTLSWSGIADATTCSIDQGVGIVPCSDGWTSVSPGSTMTYTLTADGIGGGSTRTATVTVVTGTQTFSFTGAQQDFTVPAGVHHVTVQASGAQGGTGVQALVAGGYGGTTRATISVTPGESLAVFVGGRGANGTQSGLGAPAASGGFNGGGDGSAADNVGGGGGGASDVRQGGSALTDRVAVAGGGGGSGAGNSSGAGGAGGGLTGGNGVTVNNSTGGTGGKQAAGGAGGNVNGAAGQSGVGGASGVGGITVSGGGGGGGYFGGGGGGGSVNLSTSGGGGGSSFATNSATNVTQQQGERSGNGVVVISW